MECCVDIGTDLKAKILALFCEPVALLVEHRTSSRLAGSTAPMQVSASYAVSRLR